MSDDAKTPVDQALDLFVFAPLGLLSLAREQLPKFVERGRQQVQSQMTMARMMGEFAVQQGRKEAEKAVQDVVERLNPPPPPAPVRGSDRPAGAPAAPPSRTVATAPSTNGRDSAPADAARDSGADDRDLAIPGYDSLSASQVVPRLAGLAADELEAVRAYEASTRGRRTILNKIAQLQSASSR